MTDRCAECGGVRSDPVHNTFVPGEHAFVPAPSDGDEGTDCTCFEAPSGEEGHAAHCGLRKASAALSSAVQPPDDKQAGRRMHDWSGGWCQICHQLVTQDLPQFCPGQPSDIGEDEQRKKLVAQIDAAPEPLRSYIQKLDTNADPAGDKFRLQLAEENVAILLIRVRELEKR